MLYLSWTDGRSFGIKHSTTQTIRNVIEKGPEKVIRDRS